MNIPVRQNLCEEERVQRLLQSLLPGADAAARQENDAGGDPTNPLANL